MKTATKEAEPMASRGYYPPGAGKPKQASQVAAQPVQKKADPYTLDQDRKNPDVTDYNRSEQALDHEIPDTRAEWKKDERNPVGLPAPSAAASKKVEAPKPATKAGVTEKEAARIKEHAGRCLRLARTLTPASVFNAMAPELREDLLMRQAEDLMSLPSLPLQRIQMRLEELQKRAKLLTKQAAPPMDAEPVSQLPTPAPEADEGEALMEEAEGVDGAEGAEVAEGDPGPVPPECQVFVDYAKAEHEESETPAEEAAEHEGEDLEMPDLSELDSAFGAAPAAPMAASKKQSMQDMGDAGKKDEELSDEELLAKLDDRMAAAPAPKPVAKQPVAQPKAATKLLMLQRKVQAGAASPQEYAEYQKIVRAPQASAKLAALQKLVQAGKASAAQYALFQRMKSADGDKLKDSVMDVEKPAEDYHNEDASAYTETGTNSMDFDEQMALSNPVAAGVGPRTRKADGETSNPDAGGINPFSDEDQYHDEDSHSYPADEKPMSIKFEDQMELSNPVASTEQVEEADDALTAALTDDILRKAGRDGGKEFDPTSVGEDVLAFISTKDASREPTISKEGQPKAASKPMAKVAARKVVPMKPRAPQAAAAPQKRGVRTVAGMGRTASAPRSNEPQLSDLWKTSPDVSQVFGNV